MNAQLVLGTGAYGVDADDVAITAQKNIGTLASDSHLWLLDGKTVYTTGADLTDVERVQLVVGVKNGTGVAGVPPVIMSVPIKWDSILKIDHQVHNNGRNQIVEVEFSSLTTDSEGEGIMVLSDLSYNRSIKNDKILVSYSKKKGGTISAMLDKLVEKINNHNQSYPVATSFVTAAKNGTKLVLTMANPHVNFSISMDDLFTGLPVATTQTPIIPLTDPVDILATEREFSGNMGNGNYATLGDAYWSFPQQTDLSVQYDLFNIKFQGEHDTPQNRERSAVMWLKIAVPSTVAADFAEELAILFGERVEPVEEEIPQG